MVFFQSMVVCLPPWRSGKALACGRKGREFEFGGLRFDFAFLAKRLVKLRNYVDPVANGKNSQFHKKSLATKKF